MKELREVLQFNKEFYPTPDNIIEIMWDMVENKRGIKSILEPSSGKGNIVDFITKDIESHKWGYNDVEIHMIEPDENLKHILKSKCLESKSLCSCSLRLVSDDFLSFNTHYSYDLIMMNPPFSNGDRHLLKAISLMQYGGQIVCVLNKETIDNPYSNIRKDLAHKLKELNANIKYVENAFVDAERATNVGVAIVSISIPERNNYGLSEKFRKAEKYEEDCSTFENNNLAVNDFVQSLVDEYNQEVNMGIETLKMAREYNKCVSKFDGKYAYDIIEVNIRGKNMYDYTDNINRFLKSVRRKYWGHIFNSGVLFTALTSENQQSLRDKLDEFSNYEFSYYNIKELQLDLMQSLYDDIKGAIINLFETFSRKYSYVDEKSSDNIYLYNGWKTNKSWKINKKVIIPLRTTKQFSWDNNNDFNLDSSATYILSDMFTVFGYLKGTKFTFSEISNIISQINQTQKARNVKFPYVTLSFFKKGTCHIVFDDAELLADLNRIGSMSKNWLPPSYGKKRYKDMTAEEKSVIDSFEGELSYEKAMSKGINFLENINQNLLMAL